MPSARRSRFSGARRRFFAARRERYRDHERAGRQMLPGRQDRADQGLGPGHDLGRPADQGQQQQAGVQLARVMAQLADVPLVQGPPGRVGEHVSRGRTPGQFGPDILRAPAQLPERAMLGFAQRGDRPGQPDQPRIFSGWRWSQPLGDGQHGQRRALRILQDHAGGAVGNRPGGHVQGHRHRPGRTVSQRAVFGHRGHLGRVHEAAQRRESPRGEQLEVAELGLAERAGRPVGELRGQGRRCRWGRLLSQLCLRT